MVGALAAQFGRNLNNEKGVKMYSTRLKYKQEYKVDDKGDHSYFLSTAWILNFLKDEEILLHRLSCKMTYIATQKISGPYENFTQFLLGTTQYYSSSAAFKSAWKVYKKCKNNDQKHIKPALLYKCSDPSPAKFIHLEFPDGENVYDNGRIYQCIPVESYTWEHNAAWILGNIHIHRPFLITSPLIPKFIFRNDQPHQFSAWAKEIVALSKAKYSVTHIYSTGYIKLSPSIENNPIHIKNLNADNKEIEIILNDFLRSKNLMYSTSGSLITGKSPGSGKTSSFVVSIKYENISNS